MKVLLKTRCGCARTFNQTKSGIDILIPLKAPLSAFTKPKWPNSIDTKTRRFIYTGDHTKPGEYISNEPLKIYLEAYEG